MKLRQFFLSKKKPLAMILGVSMFFLAAAVSAPSLAWFIEIQDKANTQNMSGVIHGAYFGGSGTEEDPYTISQPKQVYYFSWLQDIGYFNTKTSNQDLTQIYFKLTDDIDMSGFVLPPAGTTRFPFVGSFDGDGHTISNLTITNVYSDLTDPVTQSLDKQSMGTAGGHLKTLNNNDCEIVGFFGVIGDSDGELSTDHQTGYLLDDGNQNYTYQTATDYVVATNVVKNVAFKNLTVDSHTTNTLSGLAAGFVNGTMSRVAVDDSSLSFSNTNQAALTDFTNNLSDYSLVGYAAPQFRGNVQKAEAQAIAPTVENPNSAQGGDQWGGSIDMSTMYKNVLATRQSLKRVKYISSKATYTYSDGESEVDYTWIDAPEEAIEMRNGSYAYMVFYDGVTTDDADSFSQVFTLETAEKGDDSGYCGTWAYDDGNGTVTKLVLSSDGTGSLDGVSFKWNPSTYVIGGFGSYDEGGTVTLNAGQITLALTDSQKQTASMTLNRRYSNSTLTAETTSYMYLYGKKNIAVDDTTTYENYTEATDAVIGTGQNYLAVQKSGNNYNVRNVSTFSSGTRWSLTDEGYLTTSISGTTVYLANSSGTLSANTSTKTVWTYDESAGTISSLYNGQVYYLYYNSSWTLGRNLPVTIYDKTKGYYLNYPGSGYSPSYSDDSPTAWTFVSSHYSPIVDTSRYLDYYSSYNKAIITTSGTAYLLNGQTNPYVGEGPLFANYRGTPYYLYFAGSGWNATTNADDADSFVISPIATDLYYWTLSSSSPEASSYTTKDTYFPLTWADSAGDGSTVPTEVSDFNTGYVVSGAYADSSPAADIRVSQYGMSSLENAFGSANNYSDTLRQRMEIVTRTYVEDDGSYNDSDWTRISDDDNRNNSSISDVLEASFPNKKDYFTELKLEKYWNAKKGLKTMFSTYPANVYGLHFMNSAISKSHKIEAPYVKINGEAHYKYELPEDCIDFNLASNGFVNFFAGSYFPDNNTFFSLNRIERDDKGKISEIYQIEDVYLNDDPNTSERQPYYYTYTGGGHSSGSQGVQIFDMDWVMNPDMVEDALYYFEIPVNSGEYALGSCSTGDGAYLLYLDIGASTANYKAVTVTELITGAGKSLVYPLGVDFIELTETTAFGADKELGGLTAAIIVPAQSTGVQHYKYDEDNEGGSLVVAPPQGKSFTGTLKASFVANKVTATDAAAEVTFTSTDCDGLTSSTMRIERVTSETYDLFSYTVTQQIDSVYTLTGIPGTTLQLYAGGAGKATWLRRSGDAATVDENGLVTFTGTGEVVIKSTIDVITSNVTEYSGPESVEASQDSAGGISYVITNGEASVSWSYDAYTKTYTVRVYSTVDATIAVTKPAEGYTIVITDGTNSTPITSTSQSTTVNIAANA